MCVHELARTHYNCMVHLKLLLWPWSCYSFIMTATTKLQGSSHAYIYIYTHIYPIQLLLGIHACLKLE